MSADTLRYVAEAAERALLESRLAVDALADDRTGRSLAEGLRQIAETVAVREGVIVEIDAPPDTPAVVAAVAAELERIVREAVVNAVRHGRASKVVLRLTVAETSLSVEVTDDGAGFDIHNTKRAHGFGLVSMRERTQAIGGSLHVESRPGNGTTISVVVPDAFAPLPADHGSLRIIIK